jgi:UDP-N-acetylmuramoyl-L-alanyl-D-glutamate--2,6-diaminopimelate ligase
MLPRIKRPSISVSLRRLLPSASFIGCADVVARDVVAHSSHCNPTTVFAAIPGTRQDGADFVTDAVERGAAAILTDRPLPNTSVPQCIVTDVRRAYAELSHALFAYPSWRLGMVGVTGTNGKTTTTWLTRAMLQHAGHPTGLIGTIEYCDSLERTPASLTTPDSRTFASLLSDMVARRARFAAVELSSHALEQRRCSGTLLDVAIITNITQDHFDYHGTFEAYRTAKSGILAMVKRSGLAVLNADDPAASSLAEQLPSSAQLCTFGIEQPADITATRIHATNDGSTFIVQHGGEQAEVRTPLVGRHNISNCLAAIAAGLHFGFSLETIAAGIGTLEAVPGRLERIDCGQPFDVYVDYAHTADALSRVITALRPTTAGRLFCVFGAGGDRDRTKRPLMGAAATAADVVVVTSDNPRSESPQAIIDEILTGVADRAECHVEEQREQAIAWALDRAQPGDCVLVAGKGHERLQVIGQTAIAFDDRAVCRRHLSLKRTVGPLKTALTAG